MRNDFTTKEVTKLIGCNKRFIPSLTSKFKDRKKPIWTPKQKGSRGRASLYTFEEILMIACLWNCRKIGLPRDFCKQILTHLKAKQDEDMIIIADNKTFGLMINIKQVHTLIVLRAATKGIEL